jgi:hypothetical protein
MRILRAIAATVLAASFIPLPSVAGASPPSVAPTFRRQVYTWQWADGSTAHKRTFRSAKYAHRMKKIALLVRVRPAKPRHKVRLEVYQRDKWMVHSRAKTNKRTGRARLPINPICTSGKWCKGTFNMRLRVLKKGRQNPASLALTVTFDSGSPSTPVTPPPSKPRSMGTLTGPILFQVAENRALGPPTVTSAQALQNPDKHSQIVVDLTWDAPISYTDNPVAGYYVLMTDDFTIDTWENAWYVEYGADERDVRIAGSIIFAENPPQDVDLTVVAVDSRGELGEPAATVHLHIGCDAYGPDTGPANPYRTLCEHNPL